MAILFRHWELRPGHMNQPNINIMTKTYYVCDPTYEQQKVAPTNRRPAQHTHSIPKSFNTIFAEFAFALPSAHCFGGKISFYRSIPSTTRRENRSVWGTLSRTNNKSLDGAKFVLAACAIASPRCTTSATFILMRWSSSCDCVQLSLWTTHINFSLISK